MTISGLNNRMPLCIRSNSFGASLLSLVYIFGLPFDKALNNDLNENIKKYQQTGVKASYWALKMSILKSLIQYSFTPYEYRSFDLYNRNKNEQHEFMSNVEVVDTFCRDHSVNFLPRNKYERYLLFKNFFKRDVIHLLFNDCVDEINLYNEFRGKHCEAIIKPIKGKEGRGVEKIKIDDLDYYTLKKMYGSESMLEEVIQQADGLACFHPASINTIRFVSTLNADGKWNIFYTLFRTGCGGSVVDNVGSGGIIAFVSPQGIIESDGTRKAEFFTKHPDTNITFKGYEIPAWDELCALAEKAHRSMPQQRLFGWDFALTTKGWDLVEVNPSPAFTSYQIIKHTGMRPRLEEYGII